MKTVSDEMIRKRVLRTGDGSNRYAEANTAQEKLYAYVNDPNNNEEGMIWGWDDKDMNVEDKCDAKILNKID